MKNSAQNLTRNSLSENILWSNFVLGRAGIDFYPEPAGTNMEEAKYFSADMGGSAGNIAVALARQGRHAALLRLFQMTKLVVRSGKV